MGIQPTWSLNKYNVLAFFIAGFREDIFKSLGMYISLPAKSMIRTVHT